MEVAKKSFKKLGFVLRSEKDFRSEFLVRRLYSSLVRSRCDTFAIIWSPHEAKYSLIIERVQKTFLRYLYMRRYGYFPFLFPTDFLMGMLGFHSLQLRRDISLIKFIFRLLNGLVSCPVLFKTLSLFVPNSYLRSRNHHLFAVPHSRTELYRNSPIGHGYNCLTT